jgi:hypothetical protein
MPYGCIECPFSKTKKEDQPMNNQTAPEAPATKINLDVLYAMAAPIAVYLRNTLGPHCTVVITDEQVRVVRDECGIPLLGDTSE